MTGPVSEIVNIDPLMRNRQPYTPTRGVEICLVFVLVFHLLETGGLALLARARGQRRRGADGSGESGTGRAAGQKCARGIFLCSFYSEYAFVIELVVDVARPCCIHTSEFRGVLM